MGRLLARNGQVAAINVSLILPKVDKAAAIAESVQFARQVALDAERHLITIQKLQEDHLTGTTHASLLARYPY